MDKEELAKGIKKHKEYDEDIKTEVFDNLSYAYQDAYIRENKELIDHTINATIVSLGMIADKQRKVK